MAATLGTGIQDPGPDNLQLLEVVVRSPALVMRLDHHHNLAVDILIAADVGDRARCLHLAAAGTVLDLILLPEADPRGPNWLLLQNHMLALHSDAFFGLLPLWLAAARTHSLHVLADYCHILLADVGRSLAVHVVDNPTAVLPSRSIP